MAKAKAKTKKTAKSKTTKAKPKVETAVEALTFRQVKFVEAFRGNATEAATIAGYSARSAYSQGNKLLKNPKVVRAIQNRRSHEASLAIATRQERQRFWTEVMKNEDEKMEIRLRAAELLGKSECDFADRLQVEGQIEHSLGALFDPAQRRAILAEVEDAEFVPLTSTSSLSTRE